MQRKMEIEVDVNCFRLIVGEDGGEEFQVCGDSVVDDVALLVKAVVCATPTDSDPPELQFADMRVLEMTANYLEGAEDFAGQMATQAVPDLLKKQFANIAQQRKVGPRVPERLLEWLRDRNDIDDQLCDALGEDDEAQKAFGVEVASGLQADAEDRAQAEREHDDLIAAGLRGGPQ